MDVQNQEPLANMTSNEDKVTYRDSTYEIVSKVAYLLGVPKRIFENESCKQKSIDEIKKVPQILRG